jgi:hypothetical protein
MASGRAIAEQITANAERVRRVVPIEYRAGHTSVVYLLARYMYEGDSSLTDEEILTSFAVMARAEENA